MNLLEIKVKDTIDVDIVDPVIGGRMGMIVSVRSRHAPSVESVIKASEKAIRQAIINGASEEEITAISEQAEVDILVAAVAGWKIEEGAMFAGKIPIDDMEFSEDGVRTLMQESLFRPIRNQINHAAGNTVDFLDA